MHSDSEGRLPSLLALAERLEREDGVACLLTLPAEAAARPTCAAALASGAIRPSLRPVPSEAPAAVQAFLDRWRPDAAVWCGGGLRPNLLARAARAGLPLVLAEGAPNPRLLAQGGWMPGLSAAVVPLFARALVTGRVSADRLARAGLPPERIELRPPLEAPPVVLPCNERERRDLAALIGARPVWLAADLPLSELAQVAAAHRLASRAAHRLLLLIAPRDPDEGSAMARGLTEAGLRVALRAEGAEPEEDAAVYLADGTGETGLWLRLAPVAYLGGTLPGGPGGRHPFEAAALGSALIHGPVTAPHTGAWGRLDAAGGARAVRNGVELGHAVESLLAPDRAAASARAAWDIATEGAETLNRLHDLVRAALDGALR
nr:glycosyltransferase N-terminal domain-containing protein [Rubellimicrobium sp. CFH 75288]